MITKESSKPESFSQKPTHKLPFQQMLETQVFGIGFSLILT